MWLFEGLLMVIKVIRGWIIKISLLERPSVVTWQYHWESSPLSRLYDPSSHDQHYYPHPQMLSFLVVYWKANPCLFSCFCTCPCSSWFIIFVLLFTSSPLPNLYNFGSISPLPPSSPMAGDHLNVAFHLKLRHMNEHYRILSHKPIWV